MMNRNVCYYLNPRLVLAKTLSWIRLIVWVLSILQDIEAVFNKFVVDNDLKGLHNIQKGDRLFQICGRYLEPIYLTLVETLSVSERGNGNGL